MTHDTNNNSSDQTAWIPLSEAAKLTPYSAEYLSLLARKRRLTAKKIDGSWHTTPAIVSSYLQEQAKRAEVLNRNPETYRPFIASAAAPDARTEPSAPAPAPELSYPASVIPPIVPTPVSAPDAPEHPVAVAPAPTSAPSPQTMEQPTQQGDALFEEFMRKFNAHIDEQIDAQHGILFKTSRFVRRSYAAVFTSPKLFSIFLVLIVLAAILPFRHVSGFAESFFHGAVEAVRDAQTVMGFRPGTHANEILLLGPDGEVSIFGTIETEGQFRSYAQDGIAPITVSSKTKVERLNTDYLDDLDSTEFTLAFVTKNGNVTHENVTLEGTVEVGSTLLVRGATKLLDHLSIGGLLSVLGDATIQNDLTVHGTANFNTALIAPEVIAREMLTSEGDLTVHGTSEFSGRSVFGDETTFNGRAEFTERIAGEDAHFNGRVTVEGTFVAEESAEIGNDDAEVSIVAEEWSIDEDGDANFESLDVGGNGNFTGALTAGSGIIGSSVSATSQSATSSFAGPVSLAGPLADGSGSAGISGYVLQSSGTGTRWVATSSLGITGGGGGGGGGGDLNAADIDTEAEFESTLFSVITPGENDDTADDLSDNDTDDLTEGTTNLYFTDARARNALSETIAGIDYATSTGIFSLASGYAIPLSASTTEWATAYSWGDHGIAGYLLGTNNLSDLTSSSTARTNLGLGTLATQDASDVAIAGGTAVFDAATSTDLAVAGSLYLAGLADGCVEVASGLLTSTGTNCGTSSGGITTLNGLTASLQSFATSSADGLALDISSSGSVHTFTASLAAGYEIPLSASTTEWSTAYSWGDHALAGYLTSVDVSDDTNLTVSATGLELSDDTLALAAGYVIPLSASTTEWSTAYSWGDHALANYLDLDTDDTDDLAEGTTNLFFTNERAGDAMSALIVDGTNITTAYDDAANTLTISASDTDTTLTEEEVEDFVGTMFGGTEQGITVTYDDAGNVVTFVVDGVTPSMLASADFGDFTCDGTSCSFDADTVSDNEIDYANVTLSDFTNDAAFIDLTDLSSSATGLTYTNTTGVFSLTSGYTIPLSASTTEWATAYSWGDHALAGYIVAANADTEAEVEAFLTDVADIYTNNDGALTDDDLSDNSTSDLTEGTNLYFTDTRARTALSETIAGIDYATSTGIFSLASGYAIPLSASTTEWSTAYSWGDHSAVGYLIDITSESLEDLVDVASMAQSTGDLLLWNGTAWTNVATSTLGIDTTLSEDEVEAHLFDADNTGTLSSGTLALDSLVYTGTLDDANVNDALTVGAAGSVADGALSANVSLLGQEIDISDETNLAVTATGLTLSGDTLALSDGYEIPLSASTTEWATAYSWGDHALAGYIVAANADTEAEVEAFLTDVADIYTNNDGALTDDDLSDNDTDDLAEGSANLYWTQNRFNDALSATTSIDTIATLANLSITESQISDLDHFTGTDITGNEAAFTGWDKDASDDYTSTDFAADLASSDTDDLTEGTTNLYFTDTRARTALSETIAGIDYATSTGIFSLASGYAIPLSASTTEWSTAYSWGDHALANYFDKDIDDTDDLTEGGTNLFSQWSESGSEISYSGGNVGIGTADPSAPLNVVGTENTTTIRLQNTNVNYSSGFGFQNDAGAHTAFIEWANAGYTGPFGGESLTMFTFGYYPVILGTFNQERIRITPEGNVGIGDTTPASLLTVGNGDLFQVDSSGDIVTQSVGVDALESEDFGDFTCNGTACSLDTDTVSDNEIDYANVTLSDFTDDVGYLTDITGESFLDLSDTPFSYTANRILYMSSNAVTTDADFTFDGSELTVGGTGLTLSGSAANIALGSNYLSGDGGDEGVFVDTSGNVGIGTTTPSYPLDVNGIIRSHGSIAGLVLDDRTTARQYLWYGTGDTVRLYDVNSAADRFVVDSGGNVIFGDSGSDNQKLRLVPDSASVSYLQAGINSSDADADLRITRYGTNDTNISDFDIYADETYFSGNVGIGTASPDGLLSVNNSVVLGSWTAASDVDALLGGSTFGGLIEGQGSGHLVVGIRDNDNNDTFSIVSGGGNYVTDSIYDTSLLTVTADGNVGIGIADPIENLQVHGGSGESNIYLTNTASGATAGDGLSISLESDGTSAYLWNHEAGDIYFGTSDIERMRITADGNVGIGTTTPAAKLEIVDSGIRSGINPNSVLGSTVIGSISNHDTTIIANGLQHMIVKASGNVGIGTTDPTRQLDIVVGGTTSNMLVHLGEQADEGGYLGSFTPSDLLLTGGADFASGAWAARDTSSSAIRLIGGEIIFFGDSGLTVGGSFTPTSRMLIDSSGKVGLSRTPTANLLEVAGSASKSTAGDWLANSDRRIKDHILDAGGLEFIRKLRPVTFEYTDEYLAQHPDIEDRTYYNFIAQEFAEVFPDAVKGSGEYLPNGEEILQLDTHNAFIASIRSIQELDERTSFLDATSTSPQGAVTSVLDRLAALAEGFVDGVLKVAGIKTDELCVGSVCVDESTFLQMVHALEREPEQDSSDDDDAEEENTDDGPSDGGETGDTGDADGDVTGGQTGGDDLSGAGGGQSGGDTPPAGDETAAGGVADDDGVDIDDSAREGDQSDGQDPAAGGEQGGGVADGADDEGGTTGDVLDGDAGTAGDSGSDAGDGTDTDSASDDPTSSAQGGGAQSGGSDTASGGDGDGSGAGGGETGA